ncbi:PBS lyase [Pseudomonas sp. MM213]|uniref:HEAT repeat domain-containing protein n=1 Tax=unclassified Pseudomonas TaxID=196821 RepID=UPI001783D4B7|nr:MULTISPECIES: PBS lyase [unclassified Pseudomonas]MBD9613471.1 PBS lyase [Pseudomonas sp. PDM02]UCP11422.1 PBS lyase [Pseudomonas sp. MM213]
MNVIKEWLGKLKNKQVPASSLAEHRRNEAMELLGNAENSGKWIEISTHYNGFIREVAVRGLRDHPSPEALVALIERLNDWVPQIRDLALEGLNHYLTPSRAQALLIALEPLIALAARRRADHGPTLMAARTVLQSPEIKAEVYANFLARQGKAARYLFALLLEKDSTPETLLRDALAHRELTVRLAAVSACQDLPAAQASPLLLEALSRPGAKVRVCVLRALLPLFDDPRPILCKALLDASASIRSLARWAAARHDVDANAILKKKLNQGIPTRKQDWLGVIGLATELNFPLDKLWLTEAMRSRYSTVRQAAVRLLGDNQLSELLGALDDPSDKVFYAAVAQLDKLSWASVTPGSGAKLDRDWHELSTARRQAILQLRPGWQQVAYLLERLATEPVAQAFWLRQVGMWCDRQYQIVDPVTSKAEREALAQKLRNLAATGLIGSDSVARVASTG